MKPGFLFVPILMMLLLHGHGSCAQTLVRGTIKDAKTRNNIPFPAVGIIGTQYGVLGDENGRFEITTKKHTDTLLISAIGYKHFLIAARDLRDNPQQDIFLEQEAYTLAPISVKPKKNKEDHWGTIKYSKKICTAFAGENSNWRGEQAAILAVNKEKKTAYLESFGFYIIKNEYADSLHFRLMLYEVNPWGYPGNTLLKKPIIFKTAIKQGEVRVDLTSYDLSCATDVFISLECLEEEMEGKKFCFAGSIQVPSYVKTSPFARWSRVRGGGGDFNLRVIYME